MFSSRSSHILASLGRRAYAAEAAVSLTAPRQTRVFWKAVSTRPLDPTWVSTKAKVPAHFPEGTPKFGVFLDARPLRTHLKQLFEVPCPLLAELIAAEWSSQREHLKPLALPLTSLISRALDGPLYEQRDTESIIDGLVAYLHSDTLCFPEPYPAGLVERQNREWTPIRRWVEAEYGVTLRCASEREFDVTQSPETVAKLSAFLRELHPWQLVAFEEAVISSKSFILPLALLRRHITLDQAADASRLETLYQVGRWGQVEDTHDVDHYDIRTRLGAALLMHRAVTGLHHEQALLRAAEKAATPSE
ncbi:hypothetical protein H696_04162 [Fonticula alba]|uniref:ATP synthase mitochondrial F1 complex assembly factor 2 n=1 Tax=Fonticula alba TaxID=691883 RepID=A0A058Z886_FONAL|nr:hypothetical protein H696_04162 [Fonticula alba]KCV69752.1 hypothetical protein H696_04162 [Fonticula alba]|eukprot:XP_009496317.1 hypothetical protein H696_04162 [Fonticula alba]